MEGERSVAGYNENSIKMAVHAGNNCLTNLRSISVNGGCGRKLLLTAKLNSKNIVTYERR